MKRVGVLLLLMIVSAVQVFASDEDDVRAARNAIVDAAKAKDRAALEKWLADDFTFVHGRGNLLDRAQYLAETTGKSASPIIDSKDEKLTIYGGHTAILVSRANMRTAETETNVRATQVFVKKGDRWQWVMGQSTLLPVRPRAASIDAKLLDVYAGSYRVKAGRIVSVYRKDDGLFVEIAGRKPGELIPRNDVEFVWFNPDANVDATFTFVRDENGRAKELVFKQDGREGWRAERIN
ncbi:MAG: DUF4440 domain-containing protein [Thermoanaerobaculia bacterium]